MKRSALTRARPQAKPLRRHRSRRCRMLTDGAPECDVGWARVPAIDVLHLASVGTGAHPTRRDRYVHERFDAERKTAPRRTGRISRPKYFESTTDDKGCAPCRHINTPASRQAGHEVRTTNVAALDFPILRSQHAWEEAELPPSLRQAQEDMLWAGHIVLFFPLWLGDMPALLKGFLEQILRPGFAFGRESGSSPFTQKKLKNRSARVVVTMGMPSPVYRWFFRAHSVKSLERNILGFVGIAPVHETLVGMVGNMKPDAAAEWMGKLRRLGREAG